MPLPPSQVRPIVAFAGELMLETVGGIERSSPTSVVPVYVTVSSKYDSP
jgi:hypothetical protein